MEQIMEQGMNQNMEHSTRLGNRHLAWIVRPMTILLTMAMCAFACAHDAWGSEAGSDIPSSGDLAAADAKTSSPYEAADPANPADAESASAMYRLYNIVSGEHFYTSDAAECDNLSSVGWFYEGIGWQAPETTDEPVYRMYNPYAGDHHYTMDASERDSLVQAGWNYEDVGWHSDSASRVAVFRLYNPNAVTGTHHYTYDASERDHLAQIGWIDEGVAWYAAGDGEPGSKACNINHWRLILDVAGSSGSISPAGAHIDTAALERADSYLQACGGGGYVALNTATGACVSQNADEMFFSASTIKAVYIAALCKYSAPGIGDWHDAMYNAITDSSNSDYDALGDHFGKGYLTSFAEESGASVGMPYSKCYADVSSRSLTKMWATIYDYLSNSGPNSDMYAGLFGYGSYYKAGLMYEDSWCGPLYHIGGIEGDVVYAVMTRCTSPYDDVWNLSSALAAAVR